MTYSLYYLGLFDCFNVYTLKTKKSEVSEVWLIHRILVRDSSAVGRQRNLGLFVFTIVFVQCYRHWHWSKRKSYRLSSNFWWKKYRKVEKIEEFLFSNIGEIKEKYIIWRGNYTHTCYMKTLFTDILMNAYLIITVTDNHFINF